MIKLPDYHFFMRISCLSLLLSKREVKVISTRVWQQQSVSCFYIQVRVSLASIHMEVKVNGKYYQNSLQKCFLLILFRRNMPYENKLKTKCKICTNGLFKEKKIVRQINIYFISISSPLTSNDFWCFLITILLFGNPLPVVSVLIV